MNENQGEYYNKIMVKIRYSWTVKDERRSYENIEKLRKNTVLKSLSNHS